MKANFKTKINTCLLVVITSVLSIVGTLTCTKNAAKEKTLKKNNIIAMYLENEDGEYDLSSQNKFPTEGYVLNIEKSTCKNGGTLTQNETTKKLSLSVSNKDECTVFFDKILSSIDTLKHFNQTSNGMRTDFDAAATTYEGIYEMEDDYGTSYYYRGAVEDNYVKYGVNKDGQEMWWRIIRINGDGSVRMIYDGTQGYANGILSDDRFIKTDQSFNARYNDAKYVGWMYGPEGTAASTSKEQAQSNIADSDIKKVVDTWYKDNIEDTGYGANVSDSIFCNDRSTPGKDKTEMSIDTSLGYGTEYTAYGALGRFMTANNGTVLTIKTDIKPHFACPQKNDAFTVDDTKKGNGALTYPVGLITADEIVAAGSGKYGTSNSNYYLYHGGTEDIWSSSPSVFTGGTFGVFHISTKGSLSSHSTGTLSAIVPVINLSVEYANTLKGTGTIEDPYKA